MNKTISNRRALRSVMIAKIRAIAVLNSNVPLMRFHLVCVQWNVRGFSFFKPFFSKTFQGSRPFSLLRLKRCSLSNDSTRCSVKCLRVFNFVSGLLFSGLRLGFRSLNVNFMVIVSIKTLNRSHYNSSLCEAENILFLIYHFIKY